MRKFKHERQLFEYNRQCGQNIIRQKIIKSSKLLNNKNYNNIRLDVKSFIKKTKQHYNIKNVNKIEVQFDETIRKFPILNN